MQVSPGMQMTKENLDQIEALAERSPIWQLSHLINLVRYGLTHVTEEVRQQGDALMLKLNKLAEQEAVLPQGTASATVMYPEPHLQLPDLAPIQQAA